MGTRKSVAALTNDEINRLVTAVNALKQPDPVTGVSVHDQFVAVHGAVMRIEVTFQSGQTQTTNMAHWNIGFCPWHRQYLLAFERALQTIDISVTLPYWDWDDPAASHTLFSDGFAGSLGPSGGPADVVDGRFAPFPITPALAEIWGTPLTRGGGLDLSWPPTVGAIAWLENLRFSASGTHPLWIFWRLLEAGWPNLLTATHNAGHNYVGGHMGGDFSPNDPVFWFHHANVDRIWARWQQNYLAAENGNHPDDWPLPEEPSPLDNRSAPYGHRRDDLIWPWVGAFDRAFATRSISAIQAQLLPDISSEVRVRDVLDISRLDYDYL